MTAPRKPRTTRKIAAVQEASAGPNPENADPAADLTEILPDPARLTIAGIPARVKRLATRELMAAIRVLTTGMGAGITQLDLNGPRDEQLQVLLGLMITAIPDASDEFVDLLGMIVEPVNKNDALVLRDIMGNPPLDVTMDVLAIVAMQERDDLTALLGKAQTLLGHMQALYRTGKRGT
jgi:hypothetical protein